MENKHKYGYDLESDLKELYGKDYEIINEMRRVLFLGLENEQFEVKMLRNIIQNPVPISKEEYIEWKSIINNLKEEYSFSYKTINNLKEIENFVKKYHLKEVI